ncbi:Zn(2+)-responsive transcriptional regulator [Alteromonas lipotrueiana]|uniref:Zn(2+)-responsive transcriptional regulator n=1 Tax=Alteromonas lipotrueiana TaxID=2803815 RepID=UPI001C47C8C4|nr:Zn(2+)-responsive transcriptional regulator [Alteromonas lipotrueiana]|tara:strand:+ start:217 stop:642 length:426 start_codon:yes stop_codon:yes gene_type:complete
MKTPSLLKIGELATRAKVSVDTIRFYENKDLLRASRRSSTGYRLFIEEDLTRLLFIVRAKQVGFTLDEIGELLELKLHPEEHTCQEVKQKTQIKIDKVSQKIAELERIRRSLVKLHRVCGGGTSSAQHCSILQLLESDNLL